MIRLLSAVTRFTLIFVAAIGAMRLSSTPAKAFIEAGYCSPQPCWYHIYVGKTSLEQAKRILSTDRQLVLLPARTSIWDFCWNDAGLGSGCIAKNQLGIHPKPGTFLLADAILLFGYPTSATHCGAYDPNIPSNITWIGFDSGITVFVFSLEQRSTERFDPDLIVDRIMFSSNLRSPIFMESFRLFGLMHNQYPCGGVALQ